MTESSEPLRTLTVAAVGQLMGVKLPGPGARAVCPLRKHKRGDKSFRISKGEKGDEVWRCYSCDAPEDKGDAVSLWAYFTKVSRKQAWTDLLKQGFQVPGATSDWKGSRGRPYPPDAQERAAPAKPPPLGPDGVVNATPLPLDKQRLYEWSKLNMGAVARFGEERGILPATLKLFDVIEVPVRYGKAIGFVYHDPATGEPCRIKVRTLGDKRFWMEPRPEIEGDDRRALAPLYLGHRVQSFRKLERHEFVRSAIITEGEVDALSLVSVGFQDVVSLPDGALSASKVDFNPIYPGFCWLIATDDDEKGDEAFEALMERARYYNIQAARVRWRRLESEDFVYYKDANDALRAGFTFADFQACIDEALETLGVRRRAG